VVFANKSKVQVLELKVLRDYLKYKPKAKKEKKSQQNGWKRLKLIRLREILLRVREDVTEKVVTILMI
jgi:hypothetical protein